VWGSARRAHASVVRVRASAWRRVGEAGEAGRSLPAWCLPPAPTRLQVSHAVSRRYRRRQVAGYGEAATRKAQWSSEGVASRMSRYSGRQATSLRVVQRVARSATRDLCCAQTEQ